MQCVFRFVPFVAGCFRLLPDFACVFRKIKNIFNNSRFNCKSVLMNQKNKKDSHMIGVADFDKNNFSICHDLSRFVLIDHFRSRFRDSLSLYFLNTKNRTAKTV